MTDPQSKGSEWPAGPTQMAGTDDHGLQSTARTSEQPIGIRWVQLATQFHTCICTACFEARNPPVKEVCADSCEGEWPAGSTQMAAAKIQSSQHLDGLWLSSQSPCTQVSVNGLSRGKHHRLRRVKVARWFAHHMECSLISPPETADLLTSLV